MVLCGQKNKRRLAPALAVCLTGALLAGCTSAPNGALAPGAGLPETGASAHTGGAGAGAAAQGELKLLFASYYDEPDKERGFYRAECLAANTHWNLLFYDYGKLEMRVLCDAPNCAHNTLDCTSYIDTRLGAVYPFSDGEHLYLLCLMYNDGSNQDPLERPSVIQRRNLDGTHPEEWVRFPAGQLIADKIYTDGAYFYFRMDMGLYRLDLKSRETTLLWEIPHFEPPSDERPIAYTQLLPTPYGENFLAWRGKEDGGTDLLLVRRDTGAQTLLHSWPQLSSPPYTYTEEGKGYYVADGDIRCYDIAADTDTLVTGRFPAQSIQGPYEGWLAVTHTGSEGEEKMSSYNLATGETHDIPFRANMKNEVHTMVVAGNTPHGLLVIEDGRWRTVQETGTGGIPYQFESQYWVYALIDVEDFMRGAPNFRTIRPTAFEYGP